MSDFEGDAPLLEHLLMRWTLDSSLCFFDLLGFDIYHHWNREGADPKDLFRFSQYCIRLSVELLNYVDNPMNPRFFNSMHVVFKSLEGKIPKTLKPKFDFLLKVLALPNQAAALGGSAVGWFGCNSVLDGKHSRREDLLAYLDFACAMYPSEFQFIRTAQTDADLSRALSESIGVMTPKIGVPFTLEQIDRYQALIFLKQMVDQRLLQKNIPINRVLMNIRSMKSFESSKYKEWIKDTIRDHLSDAFYERLPHVNEGFLKANRQGAVPYNEVYQGITILASVCQSKELGSLEQQILKKLDHERRRCKDPEAYAPIFVDMVRLYQIIHDIRFLKDATKDQLEGLHIPDSFVKRAFLLNIDVVKVSLASLSSERRVSLPQQSSSTRLEDVTPVPKHKAANAPEKVEPKEKKPAETSVPVSPPAPVTLCSGSAGLEDVTPVPKHKTANSPEKMEPKEKKPAETSVPVSPPAPVTLRSGSAGLQDVTSAPKHKVKTRPEKLVEPREEKRGESSVSATPPAPVIERPYFPAKDASGQEVISHLLNHGFVIDRKNGSHYHMEHVETHVHTTVPYHESIKLGTLSSIRDAFYRSQGFGI
jgi:predicted RNA binding protein YcfA (HicA-like mRNA interferase family)